MNLHGLPVTDLFERFGFTATYRVTPPAGGPAFNPTPGVPVDYEITVLPEQNFVQGFRNNSMVRNENVVVSATGFTVDPLDPGGTDVLIIDGTTYQILEVRPVRYGETIGHYELEVAT